MIWVLKAQRVMIAYTTRSDRAVGTTSSSISGSGRPEREFCLEKPGQKEIVKVYGHGKMFDS